MPKPVAAPQDDLASNEMLRVGEVAQLLQVHPNTVRYYGRIGALRARRRLTVASRTQTRVDFEKFHNGLDQTLAGALILWADKAIRIVAAPKERVIHDEPRICIVRPHVP